MMVMLLELVSTILPKYHINKLYLVISHPWRIPHASSLPVQAYLDGKCTTCSCNMSYSISMAMYKRWSQNFWITWLLSHFVESFKWNVIPYPATHTHTHTHTYICILYYFESKCGENAFSQGIDTSLTTRSNTCDG